MQIYHIKCIYTDKCTDCSPVPILIKTRIFIKMNCQALYPFKQKIDEFKGNTCIHYNSSKLAT
jgi:hypothetical protein